MVINDYKKIEKVITFLFFICFLSFPVSAGIISYGGYSYDDSSNIITGGGLDWLRWDETDDLSVDSALALHQGYRLATYNEMGSLLNTFFPPSLLINSPVGSAPYYWDFSRPFNNWLDNINVSQGFYLEDDDSRDDDAINDDIFDIFTDVFGLTGLKSITYRPYDYGDDKESTGAIFGDANGSVFRLTATGDYTGSNRFDIDAHVNIGATNFHYKNSDVTGYGIALVKYSNTQQPVIDVPEPNVLFLFITMFAFVSIRNRKS